MGDYDPQLGKHLVLWDLQLMIEFPPGAVILLPSTILRHLNIAMCMSFTQFSPGGLWHWIECGYQTQEEFLHGGSQFAVDGTQHWTEGLATLTHLEEFALP